MKSDDLVNFKQDKTKTQFTRKQALDLIHANKILEQDFVGMNYDPNFPVNIDELSEYLNNFTTSSMNEFDDNQIMVIKDVFCL